MPDASGKFKGISVPSIPWHEKGHGMTQQSDFGVRVTLANGEDMVVTLQAADADDALKEVRAHQRLFYGGGDTAGRWLASKNPRTITAVHEARPISEWELTDRA